MPESSTSARGACQQGLSNSAYLAAAVGRSPDSSHPAGTGPMVVHSGRVVQAEWRGLGAGGRDSSVGGGLRGTIEGLTPAARRRMLRSLSACRWDEYAGDKLFSSLTYPAEFPLSGELAKGHLQAWRRRYQREFGAPVAAWKQEFQARGAPHFHLYHVAPELGLEDFREWLSHSWYDVVDSGDPKHLKAGTSSEVARDNAAFYFAGYTSGKDKKYQDEVPEAFRNVGRFWGLWNIQPAWERQEISARDWFQLRRLLVRYRQSRARTAKKPYRFHSPQQGGLWAIGGKRSDDFYCEVQRAMEVMR